jgi:hypothetical protein
MTLPVYGESSPITMGAYLDIGYLGSSTNPANRSWRTKSTSAFLDELELNNVTVFVNKSPTAESPWGFEVGTQDGRDVDLLVTSAAASSAEWQRHLHNTNLAWRFPVRDGLTLRAGLITGNFGYESFHGIDSPNYTRPYSGDLFPYYHWGLNTTYQHSASLAATLLIVNGFDYLAPPNDGVSFGPQIVWTASESLSFKQNFYFGPEQDDTALEFWRSSLETIAEWRQGRLLLAGVIGYGAETQSGRIDTPRFAWSWGVVYAQWLVTEQWRVGVRPEFLLDVDGVATGIAQTINAATATVEYRLSSIQRNTMSARLEYRFDRSTGREGGFYSGAQNTLVPDQQLFIATVMWRFDS